MQDINAQMPVNAFLECEGKSFRIKSGHVTEAICRSFDAQLTFSAFERYDAKSFLGKFCTLSVVDSHGEKRTWVGECQSLTSHTDDGVEWNYTFEFESILSRLKKSHVHFRTDIEVDLKDWVKALFKRHGIGAESLEWRFNFREVRPRLIQVLQSDHDFLLKILAQENIVMWPSTDKPTICFADDPDQWHSGSIERIFYIGKDDLIQHGGEKIGVMDYHDIYERVRSPDEEDNKRDWENKSPERLYSGIPYLIEGMGGPALKPVKHIDYDQKSMQALFRKRETNKYDENEVYRYLDATSNAIAIAVGHWISLVDIAKSEETKSRITYVKHEFTSSGKTLRYQNRMLLQPAMAIWRGVSPLKPILPLVMQAYIEGDDRAPSLNAWGEEQISFAGDASQTPKPFDIPRMRSYVNNQGGMSFPLGHRTEVLISFLYGEADLPIIVGAVPNQDTPSPVNGTNAWDHILSTRSGNKLRLNDDTRSIGLETSPSHGMWLQNGKGITLQSQGGFVLDVKNRILCQIGKSWNMLAGNSMACTAAVSQTYETSKGDMVMSAALDINASIQKSMSLYVKSQMKMQNKYFKMRVGKEATITVKKGDVRYQIKGAVTIQGGKGIKIVGGERLVFQSANDASGFVIERDQITIHGNNLIGLEADALELKGNVAYEMKPRVSNPVQALRSGVGEEENEEIKKLVMHEIKVYGPTRFYGKTVMPGELDGLLYMISTEPMSIDAFVKSLYEEPSEAKKANIVKINPHLKGCIEPGQMVYVADGQSDVYQKFGENLRTCADEIEFVRKQQLPEEASAFAKQYALMGTFGESIGGAPGYYSTFNKPEDTVGVEDIPGMITTAGDKYIREQIKSLEKIDAAYNAHPMSNEFIAARAQALKEMDLKTLELLDTLVMSKNLTSGKVLDASIRMQVGVQEWIPTANKLTSISDQYKGALKVQKALKVGGNIMIGYDALSTYQTIQEACIIGREHACQKVSHEETGGFLGRTTGGGIAVYIAAAAVELAPLSAGTSLVVGVIACAVAGYFGSKWGDEYGKEVGTQIFESEYRIGDS